MFTLYGTSVFLTCSDLLHVGKVHQKVVKKEEEEIAAKKGLHEIKRLSSTIDEINEDLQR